MDGARSTLWINFIKYNCLPLQKFLIFMHRVKSAKNYQNGTFLTMHEIWFFGGPNNFIWSGKEESIIKLIHKVPLTPSKCWFKWIKWINRIISKSARAISNFQFILGSYKFLAYLACIRSYAWSFGHSDPDLSSVSKETSM